MYPKPIGCALILLACVAATMGQSEPESNRAASPASALPASHLEAKALLERVLDERDKIRSGYFVVTRRTLPKPNAPDPRRRANSDNAEIHIYIDGALHRTDWRYLERPNEQWSSAVVLERIGLQCSGDPGGRIQAYVVARHVAQNSSIDLRCIGLMPNLLVKRPLRERRTDAS
ncbi:MAG: hypothetical protein JXQ73_22265 [Phycisphaerae bacterium]|nr:hypothetical protein [Phycisphaerae bacterium]